MKKMAGLWIDHKKAVIVVVAGEGGQIRVVISNVDKQLGRSGNVRSTASYEPQLVPADNRRQRRLTGRLNIYYDAVIACIQDAADVLIFGPGEAKGELNKRIRRLKSDMHIVGIETSGRMTDRQISAKVLQYFREQ